MRQVPKTTRPAHVFAFVAFLLPAGAGSAEPTAPLLDGMGSHHHQVTTKSALAQRYFDQGLVLAFGFNHKEAARSFRQAQVIDPDCGMCFWGEALVLGPNINAGMDPEDGPRAFAAVRQAVALKYRLTDSEAAYIEALAHRYADPAPGDRSGLDHAYAEAMGNVARRFPDDADAASLYAEALMDTMPWDYWQKDGAPRPATRTVLSTLESVLEDHADHPLANHLYIHAVEKEDPQRGIAAADRLRGLVPGAGHLTHMPGHIYIRVGRYEDAVIANEQAIAADDAYIAQCHAQGLYPLAYMPHNHHFLAAAAGFIGRGAQALRAARHMQSQQDPELMREPGYGTLQHYWAMPYFVLARFGRWDELLAEPRPAEDLLYPTGIWHYARGLAWARNDDRERARSSLAALVVIADDPDMDSTRIWETHSMAQILAIAREILSGELALASGEHEKAIAHLEQAVRLEDDLVYVEPPDWYVPARHNLGAALLTAGRAADAEAVYRRDLEVYPGNGWSLRGLERALRAQGRELDADAVADRFQKVWAQADIEIQGSRL
jgi:tetratricopeptide (TPR) repeat protein